MCDNANCATKNVTLQKRRISGLQDVNNAYNGVTEYVSRFCSICAPIHIQDVHQWITHLVDLVVENFKYS
jgi:uncharacterized membrane protein YecN with MAPEG domain